MIAHPFDVLVVGSGAAGLYAALCLPKQYRVGLITKDVLTQSASDWAQGGIAAAIAPDDSPDLHLADTLEAGAGLCDRVAVEQLVREAKPCIEALIRLGVPFDQHDGDLALTLEAAHSRRRVLHAADTTGRAVVATLADAVRQRSHITVLERTLVLDLGMQAGRCVGVVAVRSDRLAWISAGAVVLATGGGGQVFSQTTNPPASTGDGVAIAWRAGALLRDLEFFQFHPTALKLAGAPRFLISEAVRGEGAHLIDAHNHRFAFDYHPKGELAPRDVVSRAIYRHLASGQAGDQDWVWLDLRPIDRDRVQYRFPNILKVCQRWGVDPFEQPIPISPAAHYWMGGVWTDLHSKTTLPALYAVGETASTGVHGANRLASNSLLECLVYGQQLRDIKADPPEHIRVSETSLTLLSLPQGAEEDAGVIAQMRAELPTVVWQGAGICRNATDLAIALAQVTVWRDTFSALATSQALLGAIATPCRARLDLPDPLLHQWCETRNLLDLAWLILTSAQFRTESRGGHYREDYPQTDPDWAVHTLVQGDRWWKSDPA